jgi:hypothetical protein
MKLTQTTFLWLAVGVLASSNLFLHFSQDDSRTHRRTNRMHRAVAERVHEKKSPRRLGKAAMPRHKEFRKRKEDKKRPSKPL